MPSKKCGSCGETKEVSEFHKCSGKKDGLQTRCKACCREYDRKYRQENADAISEQKRQYYLDNTDAYRERRRQWERDNPDKKAAYGHRRRARKAAVPSDGVPVDITDQPCYVCGADAEAVDHVIPIAKGGPDTVDNKMPICKSCNSAKGAHVWPDKPGWDEFVERRRNQ